MTGARRLGATVGAIAVLGAACGTTSPTDDVVDVGGVEVTPPDGWRTTDGPEPDGVRAVQGWTDPDEPLRGLQVVVGCDPGGVDDLVTGAVGSARGALVVTAAEELMPRPSVEGLEDARRVSLTLGGEDGGASLAVEALYGQAGDALVLVEVSAPVSGTPPTEVLDTVRTNGDTLTAGCD